MTIIPLNPECPVCLFPILPRHPRFNILRGDDDFLVNTPIHQECRANVDVLDPHIYLIPKPDAGRPLVATA